VLLAFPKLYATSVFGWHVLRRTPAARLWVFELADVFGAWLYLPLPLLLLLVGLYRAWREGAWLALPMVAFGWEYGAHFWPPRLHERGPFLRVMTANLWSHNHDANSLAVLLKNRQPDVLAVQELGPDMAARLAWVLQKEYPYQALCPSDSTLGMGVFSRYPILGSEPPEMGPQRCSFQQVTFEFESRPMRLFNVHPVAPRITHRQLGWLHLPNGFDTSEQEQTLRGLIQCVQGVPEPVVIVGDFNVGDRQRLYRIVRKRLLDAHSEAGWGFGHTFPCRLPGQPNLPFIPLVRIDYVFHDQVWTARSTRTGRLRGSDHRYVLAELVLR
jgi:endonuclease/exonuclease/phosphatase (EEP) superfamily protein YafD